MSTTVAADTRMAYAELERRARLTTAGALLALAAVAWWLTVRRAAGMSDMVSGLAQVGGAVSFDMAAPVFLAMWVTMMVAMMFPTIAPIVLLHRMVMRRQNAGGTPTATFVAGYLLVWTAVGVVPLVALLGFGELRDGGAWVDRLAGGVLVVAGAYQFTRWKALCQKACRSPLTFLSTHDFGSGLSGTLRAGVSHGLYCLGCCWALMAVLLVVGIMNLLWMAAIAAVFLAEKNWRYGDRLSKIAGTALVVYGIAAMVKPSWLPGGMPMDAPMDEPTPMDMA
jgi:predicted metal-binding membrane protein